MKSEIITFGHLEKLLVNLGFENVTHPKYQIFEHPREQARISLPNYTASDVLRPVDIVITSGTLEAYGLMSREAFAGLTEKIHA
jgi:hypothetical protein